MNKLIKILFQPYPIDSSWKIALKQATMGGLFVAFFLFFFRPFEMKIPDNYEDTFLLICIYFGLVTWVVSISFYIAQLVFPAIFKEESWKVWKEIVFTLVLILSIATANMLFSNYYFDQPSLWQFFGGWLKSTFAIGIFPIIFTAFYKQIRLSKRYHTESKLINQHLEIRSQMPNTEEVSTSQVPANQIITLLGENQNEKLEIEKNALCYLSAADNYVQVFYLQHQVLKQTLLRSSLKKMEENLASFSQFYRCHRAYIVNLEKVKRISGNAQGYKLHLENLETLIPVSRSLNEEIAKKLEI